MNTYQQKAQNFSPLSLNSHNKGFTLVEMMVVIVILSIFAGMVSVSVGTSDTQKNRAYYEHLQDTLHYIRLVSAERMQPMGITLTTDNNGQLTSQVVRLDNAYTAYQQNTNDSAKNAMELSAQITNEDEQQMPTWVVEESITLPDLPNNVVLTINPLDADNTSMNSVEVQPWFQGQNVPSVMWFGTGQSTPVTIEVTYNDRLVGDIMKVTPDGGLQIGQQSL